MRQEFDLRKFCLQKYEHARYLQVAPSEIRNSLDPMGRIDRSLLGRNFISRLES